MSRVQGDLCSLVAGTGPKLTFRGKTSGWGLSTYGPEGLGKGESHPPNCHLVRPQVSRYPCLPCHGLQDPCQRGAAGVNQPGPIRGCLWPNAASGLCTFLVRTRSEREPRAEQSREAGSRLAQHGMLGRITSSLPRWLNLSEWAAFALESGPGMMPLFLVTGSCV